VIEMSNYQNQIDNFVREWACNHFDITPREIEDINWGVLFLMSKPFEGLSEIERVHICSIDLYLNGFHIDRIDMLSKSISIEQIYTDNGHVFITFNDINNNDWEIIL
jgi:hypothetical protein